MALDPNDGLDLLFIMWMERVDDDDHESAMKAGRALMDTKNRYGFSPNWDEEQETIFMDWATNVGLARKR